MENEHKSPSPSIILRDKAKTLLKQRSKKNLPDSESELKQMVYELQLRLVEMELKCEILDKENEISRQVIASRKEAQRVLQNSEERYKALFENTSDGIYKTTSDGKFLRADNELLQSILDSPKGIIIFSLDTSYCYKAFTVSHKETMKEIWGVDIEIGMNMLDLILSEKDRKKAQSHFDQTLKGDELIFIEDYGDETLSRSFWENRYSPIRAQDGTITGLTVFVTNISDRMRGQEQLRKNETDLNEAQKLAKTGSWKFNLKTRKLTWSKELYRIFEMEGTPDEELYEAFRHRIYKGDLQRLDDHINDTVEKGEGYVLEHRIYTRGDDIKCVFCKGEPIFDDQGQVVALKGVTQDITEKKARERIIQQNMEALNRKNEELELLIESNLQLENFAYIASHDLKSPVRTISSFSGLLKSRVGSKLDEQENKFLDFIINGANEVQHIIEDLLTYSKIKSKTFAPTEIETKILLKELLTTMSTDIKEYNAKIEIGEVPRVIQGDRTKMWQLFQNLLSNAMRFHEKGVFPHICITAEERKNDWLFSVTDNGIGIHPEFHDKIFVLFQQLNTKDQFEGTGLGLAICKKIVDQHKGRIWVESKPGKGAAFYFTIQKMV